MSQKVKVAVYGATGYGGAELLRNLFNHPHVEVVRAVAIDHVGKSIGAVHPPLAAVSDLTIEEMSPREAAEGVDAIFFGLPHMVSAAVISEVFDAGVKIIDLSGDFRLQDHGAYEKFYGLGHPCPEASATFTYGLPELNRHAIAQADRIASPGCFATTITLGLLPMAQAGLLAGPSRTVAMTGSSGSGAAPKITTHHALRATNLRTYKPLNHQHTPEIVQTLTAAGARDDFSLQFVPISTPLVRGIMATSFIEVDAHFTTADAHARYEETYADEPLVRVVEGRQPEVNTVAGSIYTEVGFHVGDVLPNGKRQMVCFSALDNLVKGGAGQAIQSFNIMMGWPDAMGIAAPSLWP